MNLEKFQQQMSDTKATEEMKTVESETVIKDAPAVAEQGLAEQGGEAVGRGDAEHAECCVICYEASPNCVMEPCGHCCCCQSCVVKTVGEEKRCPMCRKVGPPHTGLEHAPHRRHPAKQRGVSPYSSRN